MKKQRCHKVPKMGKVVCYDVFSGPITKEEIIKKISYLILDQKLEDNYRYIIKCLYLSFTFINLESKSFF